MSKIIGLLNAAKTITKSSSNYQLAKNTGISEQAISAIYTGKQKATEEHIARLALVLGRPLGELLAEVRAEDARSEKSREFWRSFKSAMPGVLRILPPLLLFGSFIAGSHSGTAKAEEKSLNVYYVK